MRPKATKWGGTGPWLRGGDRGGATLTSPRGVGNFHQAVGERVPSSLRSPDWPVSGKQVLWLGERRTSDALFKGGEERRNH